MREPRITSRGFKVVDDAHGLANHPREVWPSAGDLFTVPAAEIEQLQLTALQRRFDTGVTGIASLRKLATRAGINGIHSLADGGRLLYSPEVYKSYKNGWLEKGQFGRLTSWLQQLSAHDLSHVDTGRCESLDDWFLALEQGTELRLCHSSATSGKLSFVPRGEVEWRRRATTLPYANEAVGREDGPRIVSLNGLPIVSPFYRSGHSAFLMSLDWNIRVHGDEAQVQTLYPGHLSSDVLVLAGRLQHLQRLGALPERLDDLDLSPWLSERWELIRELMSRPPKEQIEEFLHAAFARFGGKPVFVIGVWPSLVDAGVAAESLAMENVFHKDSIVHTGGGSKGRDLPADSTSLVKSWLGDCEIRDMYGMSEIMGMNVRCAFDCYHVNPFTIPYVVASDGSLAPRTTGTYTGRYGAIDLLAESYWGGFLSNDLVDLTIGETCACGRVGPFLGPNIRRASVTDDKVSCAATPALHEDFGELVRKLSRTRT